MSKTIIIDASLIDRAGAKAEEALVRFLDGDVNEAAALVVNSALNFLGPADIRIGVGIGLPVIRRFCDALETVVSELPHETSDNRSPDASPVDEPDVLPLEGVDASPAAAPAPQTPAPKPAHPHLRRNFRRA